MDALALPVLVGLIAIALLFDFLNGLHDAANSIATIVSTRVLRPHYAVAWAAFFNFIAFLFFGLHVAATLGTGIVDPGIVDAHVIFGALMGAIVWNIVTWHLGIPSSSSHALIGGLVGAGTAKAGISAIVWGGLGKTVAAGTHGDVVRSEAAKLPSRVRGGTGVMDTTLAAYKYAQEHWDPAWFNSVVIMTDGASDDSSSLSLESLINQLKSIRDPAKPVKVIIIGISQDADTGELEQIAAATGGQNYLVNNPNEILGVLAQALLNR